MKLKSSMALIAMGVGGTLLCENIINGNIQKAMKKMIRMDIKKLDDLEDMM